MLQVGYWLGSGYEGQGLASSALQALKKAAAGLGLSSLQILVVPGNVRSIRLAERAGYAVKHVRHQTYLLRGDKLDELVYEKRLPA